jgi:oligoendopeptidase F
MTVAPLPSSGAFRDATWPDIRAHYDALEARMLTAETVAVWLADWSSVESAVTEAASLSAIAYTCDTANVAKEAAHRRFSMEILPFLEERSTALARKLVECGLEVPGFSEPLRRFRQGIAIFREANVAVSAEIESASATYQRITGGMTAEWEGRKLPLPQFQPFLLDPDRTVRERAYRTMTQPYVAARPEMAALFDQLFGLRQQMAANADFPDFQAYCFAAKNRFDYTADDCRRFHDAVEAAVVPAVERRMRRRRERLGVPSLRPWDLQVSADGALPEPAFADATQLAGTSARIFTQLAPALGHEFQVMIDEGLLDLASREGKAPGGYCDTLHAIGRPFIFMNAVGIEDDVTTLLHEAGHAFHSFAAHDQPLLWQRHPGSEACELASMSMELLAAPLLAQPTGFYEPERAVRARREHLEDILTTLPHVASVDAFQSWIYTSGDGADASARDAAWLRIRSRFETAIDWTGLRDERIARWYKQLHIFLYPFYYIEYGIAQLGALQVWRNHRKDPTGAVAAYRRALALGATRSLPELYAEAGARLIFDVDGMRELTDLVEEELERLDEVASDIPLSRH